MDQSVILMITAALGVFALGGTFLAFAGDAKEKTQKRVAHLATGRASARVAKNQADTNQARRKNVQGMLKELEKQRGAKKQRFTLRRRLDMAGLSITPRTFWMLSGVAGLVGGVGGFLTGQSLLIIALIAFAVGLGLPRWLLRFLKNRREKAFTREFATAIDIIVRSVKSGLPVTEALKVVAKEIPDPVGSEFKKLVEGQKVGVTFEQGLQRMYERMPTAEVNFFGIVMAIQLKGGGNLSEALSNLATVLRERKKLHNKIRAMSSEAKASAAIIGSLPPGVMTVVYMSTPQYIMLLFQKQTGNIMLVCCVVWMSLGVLVMRKMINFKF